MIVPTLCVGMPQWTLRVRFGRDAERPGLHSHAEHGNDHYSGVTITGGIVAGGSSRGGGVVPGGSCSGTGSGSVGGMVGLSMFGSGVSAGIGMLINSTSGGTWRKSCLSVLTTAYRN